MFIYKPSPDAHDPKMRKIVRDQRGDWNADWDADDAERRTKALAAFAFILALALFGCYLIVHLRTIGKVEDCLLAQHSDCDSLIDSP